ncbi:MAG: amidohydrolase [Bacteroidota bacterium]
MRQKIRVAALQMNLHWHEAEKNRLAADQMLAEFSQEIDLLLLPEMFTTGFSMSPAKIAETEQGPTVAWMQQVAEARECVVGGSVIIEEGGNYFNRFLWVDKNGLQARYNKRHLFSMAGEDGPYTAGTENVILNIQGWKVMAQICYDLRFPVWSRNQVQADGGLLYDLLIYVANWPRPRVRHWESLLHARAIENQAYVIGVNRVGEDPNGLSYSGSSMILDHMGDRMAYETETPQLLQAELDPAPMDRYREKFPIWQDSDAFSIQELRLTS